MAAALYNKLAKDGHADSAGTITDNAGETLAQRATYRPAAQHVLDVIGKEGIDISTNTRDLLTPDMLDKYDKVVVMAEPENTPDFLKNSPKFVYWEIEDPKGGNYETVQKAKEIIKYKVQQLIKQNEQ